MASAQSKKENLLHRVQDLLRRKPNSYDVIFCVGPAKKKVKALRILLEAASPALEKKFEKWDDAHVQEKYRRVITLPDFDPEAFEIFVKLTMLDEWTVDVLKNLNLEPFQILNLISICRDYEMKRALRNLEEILKPFYSTFPAFKDTEDFLRLSYSNLLIILSSDNLPMKELEVFDSAYRWAQAECARRNIEENHENLRTVLGDCLFEIRFPLMTEIEFVQCSNKYNILKDDEGFKVLKFIVINKTPGPDSGIPILPFRTKPRAAPIQSQVEREVGPKFSTLCLKMDSPIVDSPPFVCKGNETFIGIASKQKILVHGLGFLGPIHEDGNFDIILRMINCFPDHTVEATTIKKQTFAEKAKGFRVMFDQPITFNEGSLKKWTNSYRICYSLRGPNTKSFQRTMSSNSTIQDGQNEFRVKWGSNQLAEILYTNV